jgi:hypothetical protein
MAACATHWRRPTSPERLVSVKSQLVAQYGASACDPDALILSGVLRSDVPLIMPELVWV